MSASLVDLPRATPRVSRLPSPAESRVLALLLAGYSNKEIGAKLGRAESTVKNQVASLLRKYRVPSRARLIAQCAAAVTTRDFGHQP